MRDGGVLGGKMAANVMQFARVLRAAGLPVGPGQTLRAVEAAAAVGIDNRDDFYWALHAVLVNRRSQRPVFDQAFQVFWRNPRLLERLQSLLLPTVDGSSDATEQGSLSRRVMEALRQDVGWTLEEDSEGIPVADRRETWSSREVLNDMDFEDMSTAEIEAAKRAIARLRPAAMMVATRRFRPDPSGPRFDMRATLRAAARGGGGVIPLRRQARRLRRPPLVVLCDISGSMAQYSRMLLHFMHALARDQNRVASFVFGTRLNNITRYLRTRDVDEALAQVSAAVDDWSGGTRIGTCLATFNQEWARRVLAQGAVVLLISDGLDRDAGEGLGREMARLHRSCRRLIWLNPLMRYAGYEAKAQGARAMAPHVDDMRTVHNLTSLQDLAAALADAMSQRGPRVMRSREPAQEAA